MKLRVSCVDFWSHFEAPALLVRFPELAALADVELVDDPRAADLVVFSCFPEGTRSVRPRDPRSWTGTDAVRLFYTAENVRPDLRTCDFALSFCRDLVDPRHLRVPNYVGAQRFHRVPAGALAAPPADPTAALAAKTRFCTYVQGNPVPLREEFVRRLSRYREVTCAGPSLNNTGYVADRAKKYELYRESKFAVTFENESALGYTSEKLPDALAADCVPLYRGDPTVHRDFDPRCFLNLADFPDMDALIERVVALDQDDAAYLEVLGAPRGVQDFGPALTAFFTRVLDEVERRARALV